MYSACGHCEAKEVACITEDLFTDGGCGGCHLNDPVGAAANLILLQVRSTCTMIGSELPLEDIKSACGI